MDDKEWKELDKIYKEEKYTPIVLNFLEENFTIGQEEQRTIALAMLSKVENDERYFPMERNIANLLLKDILMLNSLYSGRSLDEAIKLR